MTQLRRTFISIILLLGLSTIFFVGKAHSQVISGNILVNPNPIVFDAKNLQEKKLVKIAFCTQLGLATQPVTVKVTQPPDNNGPIKLGKHELTFTPSQIAPCTSASKAQELGISIDPAGITSAGQFVGRITLQGGGATVTVDVSASATSLPVPNAPSTTPDPAVDPEAKNQDCGMGRVENCTLADYVANQNGFVYKSWLVMRTAVNILLVIALLAIAFSNITRISIDTYTIKKALPNLLLGVVLANASMYIIRFLADMATVATYFFVNLAGATTFREFITDAVVSVSLQTVFTIGGSIASPVTGSIVAFLVGIVFLVLLLWLAFLLYFRLAVVYLLTIISPVAFISMGLPGMDRFFKQWWQQFVKWMFMVVAMAAVFWVMILVGGSSDNQSIASILIQMFLFVTAVTMPTKLGGAVMDKASKVFMKYSGANAAKEGVTDFAQTKANQIGYRIPGVARTKAWLELSKDAAKSDIDQLKKRGRVKAQSGALGRNIQKLKHLDTEVSDQEAEMIALKEVEAAKLSGGFFDRDKRGITERKLLAEFKKRKAEERAKAEAGEERLKFLNPKKDSEVEELLREVFKATIDQEVASKEVGRAEIMQKGGISTEFLQPVQAGMNYSELRDQLDNETDLEKRKEIKSAMERIAASFEKMKKDDEYKEDFGQFSNIEEFLFAFKPTKEQKNSDNYKKLMSDDSFKAKMLLLQGRQRQTSKMFNEGVAGQIADDIKEQTVDQVNRELDSYFANELGGDKEKIKLFMKGDTAALFTKDVNANDIRSGRVIMEKYKTLMKSTSDVRNKDALKSFIERNNQVFDDEVEYQFDSSLMTDASSNDIKNRRSAAGYIFQRAGAASGQPHLINQNAKANTPDQQPNSGYVSAKSEKSVPPTPAPIVPPKPNISSDYLSNNDLTSEDYNKQVEYDEAVRKRRAWEEQQGSGGGTERQSTENEDEEELGEAEQPDEPDGAEEQE